MDPLRIKIDLFCNGINVDENISIESMKSILPTRVYRNKRASLSNGKCFKLNINGYHTVANLAVRESFAQSSPYKYIEEDGKGFIVGNGIKIEAEPVPPPYWADFELPNGQKLINIMQQHSTSILGTALSNYCSYKLQGKGCKFCALDSGDNYVLKKPEEIKEVIRILNDKGILGTEITEININSGVIGNEEKSADSYIDTIKAVKEICSLPVYAQLCPVEKETIMKLKEAGLDSVSFNIEIYDEKIRKEICPGKGEIPLSKYLTALSQASEIFGKEQTSSWLIVGLEPPESTIAGIEAIAKAQAIPHLTVFRPLSGTELENRKPPDTDDVIKVYKELPKILNKYGLNPQRTNSGCSKCNGCSATLESLVF
ncbi:MAG: hypothetical protein D6734_03355 [Candidatus Schekmanbacteria bacterium]|nr:MAG: hypothetical protein D6734_03355 [Candidatus Schekmanbacteria bacterium]